MIYKALGKMISHGYQPQFKVTQGKQSKVRIGKCFINLPMNQEQISVAQSNYRLLRIRKR